MAEPGGRAPLGVGIGWRPELDRTIEALDIDFVEVVAEDLDPRRLPASLRRLRARGIPVVPHAIGLSLGGAALPDRRRLRHLAQLAEALEAPLVSDHLAFVRAGDLEAGHLLPVARTAAAVEVACANVAAAIDALPVPLAVENVAALFAWPDPELTEAQVITEVVRRTGALLLLDVANLYANERNGLLDADATLAELPLDHVAYLHVAGGIERRGLYHDTHAHPVPDPVLRLLDTAVRSAPPAGALLEYDDGYPDDGHLAGELGAIRAALEVTCG